MSIADLSQADFDWYTDYASKMRKCHDTEMMQEIDPDLIRAFYRGKTKKDQRFVRTGRNTDSEHFLMLTTMFSGANTILPSLYYQNPNPIIQALRDATPESAALLCAALKHYMKVNSAKEENQEAVLNSYWMGIGWKKLGYRIQTATAPEFQQDPESAPVEQKEKPFNFMDMLKPKPNPLQSKERLEFVEEEGLFNASESPLNIALDHKADLRNRKAILHFLPRTLYEIMQFGGYDKETLDELYKKYLHSHGSRLDTRGIDLTLMELHVLQRNGIWVLTWIDGFKKPLQYELSTLDAKCGFQFEPLVLTNEPGVRYPISHMKIASMKQDKLNKMASTFYENVARARNFMLLNQKGLAKGQIEAIEQNKVKGIILHDGPIPPNTIMEAQSPPIQNDLPVLMQMVVQDMIEGMGSTTQKVQGKSKNKTLGQDEIAEEGSVERESGMKDRVRDWMVNQFRKEGKLLQTYGEMELRVHIAPEDFADPTMSKQFQGSDEEFMTLNNPAPLKSYLPGDYKYETNIEEAIQPNGEVIRQGIERIIATYSNPVIKQEVNNDRKVLKIGEMFSVWLETFSQLGNPKRFVEEIDSMQLAAMQTRELLMGGAGQQMLSPKPEPKEGGPRGKVPQEKEVAA